MLNNLFSAALNLHAAATALSSRDQFHMNCTLISYSSDAAFPIHGEHKTPEFLVNFKVASFKVQAQNFSKNQHKAGCIFVAWDAATAGVTTDEVWRFFVTQQMLGGVCWLSLVVETREWEQSGWLCFCVLSRQMSAALERKEVRIVSNRRVEAIFLVIVLAASVQGEPRYSRSRSWRTTREEEKVMSHFFHRWPAFVLHCNMK